MARHVPSGSLLVATVVEPRQELRRWRGVVTFVISLVDARSTFWECSRRSLFGRRPSRCIEPHIGVEPYARVEPYIGIRSFLGRRSIIGRRPSELRCRGPGRRIIAIELVTPRFAAVRRAALRRLAVRIGSRRRQRAAGQWFSGVQRRPAPLRHAVHARAVSVEPAHRRWRRTADAPGLGYVASTV